MTFIDKSLCSSDCENSFCDRHKSRRLLYYVPQSEDQSWADFSKDCIDYKKPKEIENER